jgi:signal transduction histidine kinase
LEARYADERRLRAFRDAFIGVISHELRSPITTIYGLSHVLRQRHRSLDADSLGQHLDDIHFESDRLRRLTEDLLVLSRAEGGRLIVAAEPVSVARATADSVQSEAGRSSAHHFELEVPSSVPLVAGEQLYVEQIVRNFLSNAAKYSAPGTTIRTSVTPESEGVAVRVRDQGPGIPESPERLFELFYRSPDAATQAPGAGIGLYVCSELVRAMAGRIWAAEAPEGGAEFGFWLPALQEEAAAG